MTKEMDVPGSNGLKLVDGKQAFRISNRCHPWICACQSRSALKDCTLTSLSEDVMQRRARWTAGLLELRLVQDKSLNITNFRCALRMMNGKPPLVVFHIEALWIRFNK
jgi:hypothetical protein